MHVNIKHEASCPNNVSKDADARARLCAAYTKESRRSQRKVSEGKRRQMQSPCLLSCPGLVMMGKQQKAHPRLATYAHLLHFTITDNCSPYRYSFVSTRKCVEEGSAGPFGGGPLGAFREERPGLRQ